jgi:membrane protease YdiL (CAAX protease family)
MTTSSALAILLVLIIFVGNAAIGQRARGASSATPRLLRLASWWGVIGLVLIVVTQLEGLPLVSIGVRLPDITSVGWGGALFLVGFIIAGVSANVLMPALGLAQDTVRASAIANAPLALQLALFATAAVVEELVCRGFMISRLAPVSPMLALFASVVVFTLPHAFGWKLAQLLFVAPLGLVFALFFLWRPDLPACIIAHFLVDTAGFLMMRMQR